MAGWKWHVEHIAPGTKCGGCGKRLLPMDSMIVDWQQSAWHIECLLDRLTGQTVDVPLADCGSLSHWGMSNP